MIKARLIGSASALGHALLDALYPRHTVCVLCQAETHLNADDLCCACQNDLQACFNIPYHAPLDGLVIGLVYQGGVAKGVRALKYRERVDLAPWFAARIDLPTDWRIDAVAPVPLHPIRLWLRGYNQSALLAKPLCARYGLAFEPKLLRRTRYTRSQTNLDATHRMRNVEGAFLAAKEAAGRTILLVDDVTTTHSTLYACAAALKQAGAARVYAACACAAQPDDPPAAR